MRKLIPLFLLVLLSLAACQKKEPTLEELYPDQNTQPGPGQIKVMSFNIRGNNDNDGAFNHWALRAGACRMMIQVQKPDLLGFQEITDTQWGYVDGVLPKDGYVGVGVIDRKNAFYYNPDRLEVERSGVFWLTTTPDVPSEASDGYERYVYWASIRILATGQRFFYMNTHFALSTDGRTLGINVIRQRLPLLNTEKLPVIFNGDFNTHSTDKVFDYIRETMSSTRDIAPITDDVKTYNAWGNENKAYECDHIWISNTLSCPEYRTVTVPYEGHTYISDHFPVYSIIQF